MRLYNDDSRTGTFIAQGADSARGVRVEYFSGGVNVTASMKSAGRLSFTVSPGAYVTIQVQMKVGRHAAIGSRKFAMVNTTWTAQSMIRQDAVKAVVRVR